MTTIERYQANIAERGERLDTVPQPYGRDIAAFLREGGEPMTLAHMLAHSLAEIDRLKSRPVT